MLAKVIYPAFDDCDTPQHFLYGARANKEEEAIEEVYRQFNHVDGSEHVATLNVRSFSVGDMIYFPESKNHYVCDMVGFKKVSAAFAEEWAKLFFRDRSLGIAFAITHKPILQHFFDRRIEGSTHECEQ